MLECVNVWMCECVNAWMCECVNAWMCECVNAWMLECLNAWMCECVNVWMRECVNAWMRECVNVWMCECVNAWMLECLSGADAVLLIFWDYGWLPPSESMSASVRQLKQVLLLSLLHDISGFSGFVLIYYGIWRKWRKGTEIIDWMVGFTGLQNYGCLDIGSLGILGSMNVWILGLHRGRKHAEKYGNWLRLGWILCI